MDTKNIDRVLNRFLADNDFECDVMMDTDFAYYYGCSLITYSLVVSEKMDRMFLDFAKSNGLSVDCGIFLLSFFHELGHHETMDLLEDEDCEYSKEIKETLNGDSEEDCKIYFALPDEIEATLWAIDFINSNLEMVEKLAKDLQKEIEIFYKKYEIKG